MRLAFALLLLAAAPAHAVPFVASDQTLVTISCVAETVTVRNVIQPGQSIGSTVGTACGFYYQFSVTLNQTAPNALEVTVASLIVDTAPGGPFGRVEGQLSAHLTSPWTPVDWWNGVDVDPFCEEAPCAPTWNYGANDVAAWDWVGPIVRNGQPVTSLRSQTYSFVNSTPEPGTAALLALGLAATASARRGSRRGIRGTSARRPAAASGSGEPRRSARRG